MSEHREAIMDQSPIPQQHKIMRQVLEVHGGAPEARQRIQSELRDTYYQRLLPLIDTICSEASAPDRIHRIDRLEIELSVLPPESLEARLADPFELAFRAELKAAIEDTPEIDADLELFDYFIRTGNVPWWASACEPGQLETSLNRLLKRDPQALQRVLQTAPELIQVRRRIVRAYSDHTLDGLIRVLAPSMFNIGSDVATAWLTLLESVSRVRGRSRSATRHLWWEEVLRVTATAEHTPATSAPRFYQTILTAVAQQLGSTYPLLISELHSALKDPDVSVPSWLDEITNTLWQALNDEATQDEAAQVHVVTEVKASEALIDAVRADLITIMARLERGAVLDTQLWTQLRAVIERLPADLKAQTLIVYDLARKSESKNERVRHSSYEESKEPKEALISLLQSALGQTSNIETGKLDPLTDTHPDEVNAVGNTLRADLADILTRLEQSPIPDSELWIQLRAVIERLPADLKARSLVVYDLASKNESVRHSSYEGSKEPKEALISLLQSALGQTSNTETGKLDPLTNMHPDEVNAAGNTLRADFAAILTRLEQSPSPDPELWIQLRAVIERLSANVKTQVLSAFYLAHDCADDQQQQKSIDTDPGSNLNHPQHEATAAEHTKPSAKDALIAQLRTTLEQLPSANTNKQAHKQQAAIDSSFSETDALYVGNAGLVILWPFLQPFFERLALTEDKQFKHESSAQRAVGLLQYLASADQSPAEILLPLNKILCGMAPEEVFDFGAEITAREKQECDDLLKAVIHQAPILNGMSSEGFRASFLLRQGQLGTRDDNWLLRAERQTHDIVLDRFPWSVQVVKLPWMETIMQVEW